MKGQKRGKINLDIYTAEVRGKENLHTELTYSQ
jgi:hypothetical protein